MKAQYITIWKLHGANKLATDKDPIELVRLEAPALTASLTGNPEPYFQHIDRATALAGLLLRGLFDPEKNGTPEDRLAAEVEAMRAHRAKQTERGVFLVFEGAPDVQEPDFKTRRDLAEFSVCFDAIEKAEIRELFRPAVQAVLAALGLSLSANADRRIEKIGEIAYLQDADPPRPIYSFSVEVGSARLSIASPLTEEVAADAAKRAQMIMNDKALTRPVSLLTTSLDQITDALQAFIAAWAAFEIFVNASFKATYDSQWFAIMETGAPPAATAEIPDKDTLAKKFLIIASMLDADAASTDAIEFRKLKKIRNDLAHGLEKPAHLPTEAVQKLLLKYVTLHLDRAA